MRYVSGEEPMVGDTVKRVGPPCYMHPHGVCDVVKDIDEEGNPIFNSDNCYMAHQYKLISRAWTPQPGEMVEVSNDGEDWSADKRRFLVTIYEGRHFCLDPLSVDTARSWSHIRPIPKTHTATIDGQDYEISDELYKQIKIEADL